MKAKLYDAIVTLVEIKIRKAQVTIPKGTQGTVVECYESPEGYAVDVAIPNDQLITGYDYENIIIYPEQFAVTNSYIPNPQELKL